MPSARPPQPARSSHTAVGRPARALVEHALLLLARQHGGDAATAAAASAALARWRAEDPRHDAAAQAAQAAWKHTEAGMLRGHVAPPARAPSPARRAMLGALGLLATAGPAGWFGYQHWRQPTFTVALHTEHAGHLVRDLPDGSRVELAAAADLRVRFYRQRREAVLVTGEALFNVAPDDTAPFVVHSPWGSVRVVGTQFSVAAREHGVEVRVASGRVAVWHHAQRLALDPLEDVPAHLRAPIHAAHAPDAVLSAGQAWSARDGRAGAPRTIATRSVGAWREGWLVFDATPLADALADWNAYHQPGMTLAPDAALRSLRVSGSFPLADPKAFLVSLPRILPVCVEPLASGGHRIGVACTR